MYTISELGLFAERSLFVDVTEVNQAVESGSE
jgi:hypothetical protein